MAPFLRDEGPPVRPETIQRARETLPLEFGYEVVNESGRETLLVRVPKAKPDYLHDAAEVAFYVSEDVIANTKDVLLVGHEKTARIEPRVLRDHIRAQAREDAQLVEDLRRRLDRHYGQTVQQSPSNHQHHALALRIPKRTVGEFSPDDVLALRHVLQTGGSRVGACQYGYIIADQDHERLGRRILQELVGDAEDAAPEPMPPAPAVAPAAPPVDPLAAFDAAMAAEAGAAPAPSAPVAAAAPGAPRWPTADAVPSASSPFPASATPVAAAADVETEEYEIVTRKPVQPSAPAPAAAPAPSVPSPASTTEVETEEYEIIGRKPAPAPTSARAAMPDAPDAPAAARLDAADAAAHAVHEEYEIVTRKPAAASAPAAPAASAIAPALHAEVGDERVVEKEFEIFTSKPKAPPAPSASAPMPSFAPPPAPAKTKEYEIITRTPPPAPTVAPAHPPSAPAPAHVVRDDPRFAAIRAPSARAAQAAAHVPPASAGLAAQDNGAPVVPRVSPAHPEGMLALRLREAGYELVDGVRAQGTTFAFAAHRPQGGRRILVKRAVEFSADDAAVLAPLVTALGADVGIVIADRLAPGARLATWGTRLEVVTSADVADLSL